MTVTVSLQNDEQQKTLLDFLNKMDYDYYSEESDPVLTEAQKQLILKRDAVLPQD